MSEFQAQKDNQGLMKPKSIPEHIIEGSIAIDSIEAFGSILKQFPNHPALKKKYADLLFKQNLLDLAAKSYEEAAQLFMDSGKMLQAVVSKKLQWLIKPPPNKEIHRFLSALGQNNFDESPLKRFFDKLSPREMLAIMSAFVRVRLIAAKSVKEAGDKQTDLFFIVSGTLKDSAFPSLETKEKVHRKANIYLHDEDFFGEVYPFRNEKTCSSDIETVTLVELVKISRQKLMKLCRHYPNIEAALIDLFRVRTNEESRDHPKYLRQAERYQLPIKMILEIPPIGSFKSPIAIEGYSSDISIGGICVVLNGASEYVPGLLSSLESFDGKKQIRISFPGDTMELNVRGYIVWSHQVSFNGKKTLAVGIQFQENSPKMRGMLFMFARSLGGADKATAPA